MYGSWELKVSTLIYQCIAEIYVKKKTSLCFVLEIRFKIDKH